MVPGTGTGTNFTAAGSLIRNGCTVIALTSPAQVFQITAIGGATGLTVTPAASPAIPAGTKYSILLSDSLSVDGLAQDIAETFTMYQRYMSGFADVMNGTTDVTITINGVAVTVPGQKSLAKKGANSDITSLSGLTTALSIGQGGTGAKTAADARSNLGLGSTDTPFFASIELSAATPFIDFHYGNSTTDYDVRVINGLTKTLEVTAGNGVAATFKVNGGYQCRTGTAGGYGGSLYNFNWASNAMQMFVDSSNVGTINVTSSDRELKENIEYQTDTKIAYDEVKQWRPAMFDMKARGALSANRGLLGFIANDIKEISPEVVKGTGLPEGVDLENDDLSGMYYLDPMAAIAKLTLTIQHMQGELVELKELLNTQKS
ncbi:tail fiber domain-containing protein [Enterobacter soli]|uniref:tail fiber domain-containing protein n=1 Tax=Enterobacter soli TaxID=885040 RepID=UPI0023793B0D|nr:tail fiber domain-containing protein [Enterobacter soli]MDD9245666.1 tail fiber domain-containing protein [Enterobacter soli]